MPFLRLTRDRRGFEHTYLLHAEAPGGAEPRVLYWYRTAPGVLIGRPALDEEAIRTIEEQHPHIEFDWPAILALREAMPPEDEAESKPARPPRRNGRREGGRERGPSDRAVPAERQERSSSSPRPLPPMPQDPGTAEGESVQPAAAAPPHTRGLLEELVGREIATRLRGRYAEILARIHERGFDQATLATWTARVEALDPDTWLTPDAVLAGVRDADTQFETLRAALLGGA